MPRKPPDAKKIKQFTLLAASNESVLAIKELTGLSDSTISKWKTKYHKEIEEKRKEIKNMRKKEDQMESGEPEAQTEEEEDAEGKEIESISRIIDQKEQGKKASPYKAIEQETTWKAIQKGSNSVSEKIAKEITSDYQASQVLKGARLRYQRNIEDIMGMHWDEFIAAAIDVAYDAAVEAYSEKLKENMYANTQLEMEIEDKLREAEPEESPLTAGMEGDEEYGE